MQKLLIITALCCFFARAHAQDTAKPVTEGVVRYLVTHNAVKKLEALKYLSKQRKERSAYMWGNRAEWQEYTLLYFNPEKTKYVDSEERVDKNDEGYSWRKETYFTTRDFVNRTIYDGLTLQSKTYLVQDSLHCQDWKIMNDLKEVAGHLCMNASWQDTVKDQKIIAWFALDIPSSAGPERLCGLPGLILEVNVNDGAMVLSADRIDTTLPANAWDLPKKPKGKKTNDAGYVDALKKIIQDHKKEEMPFFWDIRY